MRTVVSNREVPHLWAHQTQEQAWNSQKSLSFRGTDLYSYSTMIARLVTTDKGQQVVFMCESNYSHTTSGHKSDARAATNHLEDFVVPDVSASAQSNLDTWNKRIVALVTSIVETKHGGRKAKLKREFVSLCDRVLRFAEFFGLSFTPPEDVMVYGEAVRKQMQQQEEERQERQKREQANYRRKALEQVKRWIAGETAVGYLSWSFNGLPECYLRVVGDEVETSHGAKVPLAHVKRALPIVLKLIRAGKEWVTNGHSIHLGNYQLDRIDADGTIHAGCHLFQRKEVERFAALVLPELQPA